MTVHCDTLLPGQRTRNSQDFAQSIEPETSDGYTIAGVHYPSLSALALAYHIKPTTLSRRLKSPHWSLEQACGLACAPKLQTCHLGKPLSIAGMTFPSINAACNTYGIKPGVFHARRRGGWSTEEALQITPRTRPSTPESRSWIVAGRSFASLREACSAHGLKSACVRSRLAMGWSFDEAFGLTPRKPPQRLSAELRSGETGTLIICGKPFVWKHHKGQAENLTGLLPQAIS